KRYEEAASAERERLREMDILSYSIKEIDEANLKENEEEELEKERKILMEGERLFGLLDTVYESISESRGGALAQLREARSALEGVASINPEFSEHLKRIEESFFEIEDVVESVRKYRLEVDFSPERLEECERRLVTIRALEKKYGDSIKEVLSYRWDAEERLKCLGNWEEEKEKLEMEIQRLERRVFSLAGELSRGRKLAATDLEKNIQEKLKDLGMAKPVFKVEIKRRESEKGKPKCNQYGIDWIEFTISPNVGEPPKPLREIASGGEISRIMLAIKSVLAESDRIKSLIFDEIDVGIGGEVAVSVGEHLKKLSLHKQVLCITHLASIAVRADKHIKVEKSILNGRTITSVCPVDGRMRVEEIARMLSGDRRGEASLTHAEELLKRYGSPEGEYSGQNKQ
ncbi:MAG: DNA repair protein RecN, partial [Spirochaetes bacterium]